jgi:hypothetical protein
MVKKSRTWIYTLTVLALLLTVVTGCTKDNSSPDYASKIAGTYNGTITVVGTGSASASSKLSRNTDTKVDLLVTIGASPVSLNGITVSNSSGNSYTLSFSDNSGSFTGTVQGNTLSWTITSGSVVDVFTGTR